MPPVSLNLPQPPPGKAYDSGPSHMTWFRVNRTKVENFRLSYEKRAPSTLKEPGCRRVSAFWPCRLAPDVPALPLPELVPQVASLGAAPSTVGRGLREAPSEAAQKAKGARLVSRLPWLGFVYSDSCTGFFRGLSAYNLCRYLIRPGPEAAQRLICLRTRFCPEHTDRHGGYPRSICCRALLGVILLRPVLCRSLCMSQPDQHNRTRARMVCPRSDPALLNRT